MQLKIPYFPKAATMISDCVGVYEKDGLVQYIVNGLPVYAHGKADLNHFRYFTSNLIHQGLCRKVDIQRSFHVSEDSVYRYYKKFKEKGEAGFFGADQRSCHAHKIVGARKERIQKKLDTGQSVNSIAAQEGVRESAIRYHINQGSLKKKLRNN